MNVAETSASLQWLIDGAVVKVALANAHDVSLHVGVETLPRKPAGYADSRHRLVLG